VVSNEYFVVFLFCFPSSCVPYVASFSGLSFFIDPSVFFSVYSQNTAQFADDLLHFEYIRFNKYFLEKSLKTPNGVIRSRKSKQDSQCNDAQKKTKEQKIIYKHKAKI